MKHLIGLQYNLKNTKYCRRFFVLVTPLRLILFQRLNGALIYVFACDAILCICAAFCIFVLLFVF